MFHRAESSSNVPTVGGGVGADDASYGSEQYYEEDYEMDSANSTLRLTKGSRKASSGNMLPTTGDNSSANDNILPTSKENEENPNMLKRESSDISSAKSVQPISLTGLLVDRHTKKVLDIDGQNREQGAEVVLGSYKGGLNQLWTFTSEGYVESHLNGLVLDIKGTYYIFVNHINACIHPYMIKMRSNMFP